MTDTREGRDRPASPSVSVAVSSCGDCPFSMEPTTDDDNWLCSAIDGSRGIRPVGGGPEFSPWRAPPAWCPLRRASHIVALHPSGGGDRSSASSASNDTAPHATPGGLSDEANMNGAEREVVRRLETSLREYASLAHAERRLADVWLGRADAIDAGLAALTRDDVIEAGHRETLDAYLVQMDEASVILGGGPTGSIVAEQASAIRALLCQFDVKTRRRHDEHAPKVRG